MIRIFRWIGKYCPHLPRSNQRVELNPAEITALGVRGLWGLAYKSIQVRPSLVIPSFLIGTLYVWIQFGYIISSQSFAPKWYTEAYNRLFEQPYVLGLTLIPASLIASWCLMRKAAEVVKQRDIGSVRSAGQLRAFLVASLSMILFSVVANFIAVWFPVGGFLVSALLNPSGMSWDTPLGMLSYGLSNVFNGGAAYYGSPWYYYHAAPDLMAMGVSRGFVEGSALLLAPLQVFYFLTVSAIMMEARTIRAAFAEAVRVVRWRPKQFILLSMVIALIAMLFEAALPFIESIGSGFVLYSYLWWHNWSLSMFMKHSYDALYNTMILPVIVFYLRAFLAPLLVLMVFYFYRAARRSCGTAYGVSRSS